MGGFPHPNFHSWPPVRIVAVSTISLGTLAFLVTCAIGYTSFRNFRKACAEAPYLSRAKMWGFLPYGEDAVLVSDGSIAVLQSRIMCGTKSEIFQHSLLSVRPRKRNLYEQSSNLLVALCVSFMLGLYTFWFPCYFYTCDSGRGDVHWLRLLLGMTSFVVSLCFFVALSNTVRLFWRYFDEGEQKELSISIANDSSFRIDSDSVMQQYGALAQVIPLPFGNLVRDAAEATTTSTRSYRSYYFPPNSERTYPSVDTKESV
eukprot:GHVU01061483.1.p1 GENE.GHVU01061483.1~~GHVU01061483.1.p1  ORF type:complete len:259 (+),score=6.40 GHVU01061483.1:307-1083(+)